MCFLWSQYVTEKLSRKILEQAKLQQDELEAEYGVGSTKRKSLKSAQTTLGSPDLDRLDNEGDSDDDEDNFSDTEGHYYEDFVSNISNTRTSVWSCFLTPRTEVEKQGTAEFCNESSRCLETWSN